MKLDIRILTVLKISTVCIFLGRAYQYFFFDAPFREFFWDENLLSPIIEYLFKVSWHDYATNIKVDQYIRFFIKSNGILFFLAFISSIFINKKNVRFLKYPVYFGTFFIFILALLSYKERFFQLAQFFEFSIQIGTPLLLVSFINGEKKQRLLQKVKILIALTFGAHGLYALGFYPVPGHFIDMVINSIGVSENVAIIILYIAGILDLIIVAGVFVPKVSKYILYYAMFWGTVTALARFTSFFDIQFIGQSFHQHVYKVIYRIPHGLIPFVAILISKSIINKTVKSQIVQTITYENYN